MNFAILDGVVIAVVLISAILAMFRGFVREVLSIAAWVAAAILAYVFYEKLVPYVSQYVDNPTVAVGISVAAIFLVALIVVSLITMKISDFVMDSPVGALDRLLGFIFGAARGVLLVVVAVIFFNWLVDAENRPAWVTTAATYPQLSELGDKLLDAIPDDPEAAIRGAFDEPTTTTVTPEPAESNVSPATTTTTTVTPETVAPAPADTAPVDPAPAINDDLDPAPATGGPEPVLIPQETAPSDATPATGGNN